MESKLLPDKIKKKIPKLYSTEKIPMYRKKAVAKLFSPYSNFTWFILEGEPDGDDFIMFSYTIGYEKELGYVSLSELEGCTAMDGKLPLVELDEHFRPQTLRQLGLA